MTLVKSLDMSYGDCRTLIRLHREGRLAYLSGRGVRSVVVNYSVTDDQLFFLIPSYNEITQYAPGRRVTLVIDEKSTTSTPPVYESVRVRGTAQLVGPKQASAVSRTNFAEIWPQGVGTSIIYLPISKVEGTRENSSDTAPVGSAASRTARTVAATSP